MAIANAFLLGARVVNVAATLDIWNIDGHNPSFELNWGDWTAARDLLSKDVDVLMPFNGVQAAQVFTDADKFVISSQAGTWQQTLGDNVLIELTFNFGSIFDYFARRILTGDTTQARYLGTLRSGGVELSGISSVVTRITLITLITLTLITLTPITRLGARNRRGLHE